MSDKLQPGPLPEEVHQLRRRIDTLDRDLVRLLNQRSECAVKIGRLKGEAGLPIHDPEREREILHQITQSSAGPLAAEALARLFERILDESRRLERLTNARRAEVGKKEKNRWSS